MLQSFAEGVDLSENGQALAAIREVGPGSHYLGCAAHPGQFRDGVLSLHHRRQQFLRAVAGRGREDRAEQRANPIWKKMAGGATRRRRSIPAIDEALKEFIAKKKASMPDAFT